MGNAQRGDPQQKTEAVQASCFVIDANESTRTIVRELAAAFDYSVEQFASVSQFRNAVNANQQAGCVIANLDDAPDDLIDLIRDLHDLKSCLVTIAIGSAVTVRQAVQAMRSGALAVLPDPLTAELLKPEVSAAIEQSLVQTKRRKRLAAINTGLQSLTGEEKTVLDMVLQGEANKSIAKSLRKSTRTIENRRFHIYQKLQVQSLAQLATKVIEWRLLY